MSQTVLRDGGSDVDAAVADLAARLPAELAAHARLAYNYRWSWTPGGRGVFRSIDPVLWERSSENPVRLLREASSPALERAAGDRQAIAAAQRLRDELEQELASPGTLGGANTRCPVAFLCAEFAVHPSLPIYAGGLGVLAGDMLKEASDRAVPMVGVGLLYHQGYFIQRIDNSGYQHEYWLRVEPERLPAVLVRDQHGKPLTVRVPVRGREVVVQVWRVDVGRVRLFLLDAERPENSRVDRWITGRLYVSDRAIRLAQYALLGIGSVRALQAMGMEPCVVHLNEGHAALAPLELARMAVAEGRERNTGLEAAEQRTVFTTHTPLGAGNEGYDPGEIDEVLGDFPGTLGMNKDEFLHLGRTGADSSDGPFVMTPLGIRMSRAANGVSRRHGEVARGMWHPLFPESPVENVPIGHITNGVHIPTWMAAPMRELLDRHLGDWQSDPANPRVWERIDAVPDEELWQVRCELRSRFTDFIRDRAVADRLARGEPRHYVEAAEHGFDKDALTLGFGRRLAVYKRLYLLTMDAPWLLSLIGNNERAVQLVLAGKAHPQDEESKHSAQPVFGVSHDHVAAGRVSFVDNYDLHVAAQMVAGCDVWINVPRPPLEASGTSGMKAVLNGGLNLSVLDGWWAEAYDGTNGWGISADESGDAGEQDRRDANAFYEVLEREVIPAFYERDETGIPRRWVARMKASLRTIAPRFSATRMLREYAERSYRLPEDNAPRG